MSTRQSAFQKVTVAPGGYLQYEIAGRSKPGYWRFLSRGAADGEARVVLSGIPSLTF